MSSTTPTSTSTSTEARWLYITGPDEARVITEDERSQALAEIQAGGGPGEDLCIYPIDGDGEHILLERGIDRVVLCLRAFHTEAEAAHLACGDDWEIWSL